MDTIINDSNFKEELRRYLEYLEDTRYETWSKFVKPVKSIINDKSLTDNEKIDAILKTEKAFSEKADKWKFESSVIS